MTTTPACESCGMPIETGRYCGHCTDQSGQLQSFDQRFERMVAGRPDATRPPAREELERQTLDDPGHHARLAGPPARRPTRRLTSCARGRGGDGGNPSAPFEMMILTLGAGGTVPGG